MSHRVVAKYMYSSDSTHHDKSIGHEVRKLLYNVFSGSTGSFVMSEQNHLSDIDCVACLGTIHRTQSLRYKLGTWGLENVDVYKIGRVHRQDTTKLHCGKTRIQGFWCLIHSRDSRDCHTSLLLIKFDKLVRHWSF